MKTRTFFYVIFLCLLWIATVYIFKYAKENAIGIFGNGNFYEDKVTGNGWGGYILLMLLYTTATGIANYRLLDQKGYLTLKTFFILCVADVLIVPASVIITILYYNTTTQAVAASKIINVPLIIALFFIKNIVLMICMNMLQKFRKNKSITG